MRFTAAAVLAICVIFPRPAPAQGKPDRSTKTSAVNAEKPQRSAQTKAAAGYPDQDVVIERYDETVKFAPDGSSTRELHVRARAQTDTGVQQLQDLAFTLDQAAEELNVEYLRVLRSDGSVASSAKAPVNEITSPVLPNVPPYANYKRIRVPVPDLKAGETVEYAVARRVAKSPASNDFWYDHTFARDVIVLDERLEIDVPAGCAVRVESPRFPFETRAKKAETAYVWKHANLKVAPAASAGQASSPSANSPDVRLTSFHDWQGVARWYANLERGAAEPSPELRAEVRELTRHATDARSKTEAIYDYVAQKVNHVFSPVTLDPYASPSPARLFLDRYKGFGFHPPRPAAEIFKDGFADFEDEQVLLAAMLRAAGLDSDAVLISPSRDPDSAAPSPSQFDRVIAAVHSGGKLIWMDTRTAVAPFQMLAAPLRNRAALLVAADGQGRIVRTPADPPFLSTQTVEIQATLNSLGTLAGKVHYAFRGDTGLRLRGDFHAVPRDQWKELGQSILKSDGLDGEVTSVQPGDPLATRDPFEVEIEFTLPDFLDWASARSKVDLPLLTFGIPDAPKDRSKQIQLGSPLRIKAQLTLTFPENFQVQVPAGVAVSRDYAEFESSYKFGNRTLEAERSLNFISRELPPSRAADYATFARTIQADETQPLLIENSRPGTSNVPADAMPGALIEAGAALLRAGSTRSALPLLERATQLDPRHKQVWSYLGLAYLRVNQPARAIDAFRKQVGLNPQDGNAWDYLGVTLESQRRHEEAAAAFHHAIDINPLDAVAYPSLGAILSDQGRYADAVPMFEKAAIVVPGNPRIYIGLAEAYLRSGDREKAASAFEKACEVSRAPKTRSDVASRMASANLAPSKACR